jgi:translation initiation factor IF-3
MYYTLEVSYILDNKSTLINEQIIFSSIRVIDSTGEQLGVMSPDDALEIAYNKGFDLVLMSAQSNPPVCKIMDYGKYRFEKEKREKEAKKKQVSIEIKEIQLSPRIDNHDLEIKANNACKFVKHGNKVRVIMKFRGREMNYVDFGMEIMNHFAALCDIGVIEKKPILDGKNIIMIIGPAK